MDARLSGSQVRRFVYAAVAAAVLFAVRSPYGVLPAQAPGPCDPPNGNPIVCENEKPGSPADQWDVVGSGDADIQGFATDISVDQGQTVSFKVKSTTAYQLDIYRMGYYGGLGARKVTTIGSLPVVSQPACLSESSTGLTDCGNWNITASWSVPTTAVSGIYFAKATRIGGGSSHIVFIVRDDDSHSDVLFQTSDTTWQAYNQFGGNSLYVGSPAGRAYKVSYNRPFVTRGATPEDWLFNSEYPMVRWMEGNGYNVSYSTGVDTDRRGAEILEHKVFLSVGHDEYWSAAQRTNVEAARDAGVNLAFFSGNEVFWKTRWENSTDASGTPYRTLVSYKETHADAPIDPLPNVWTGSWRDPRFSPPKDGGRPENALTGTIFMVNGGRADAITVPAADGKMRFWRNTSVATLQAGQFKTLPTGTLGYEWDEDRDNGFRPAGLVRMSDTTVDVAGFYLQDYGSNYGAGVANHAMTLYRHASGALVFGAGTIQYTWGLDEVHDGVATPTELVMQQATVNLFADMTVQPLTLLPNLSAATASTDTVAPASAIGSPVNGGSIPANTTFTITGTAADTGGGVVGGVEISVDGGTSWHRAIGRASWTYTWQTGGARTVTLRTRAADDSGNLEVPGPGTTLTVGSGSAACPCSIWSPAQTPAVASEDDNQAVEIGTRFQTDTSGYISAIRFYKGAQNVGPQVGNLWTAGGTLLGSVPFTSVTASGWQEAVLPAPIAVTANTSYIVSYHTSSGYYAANSDYFKTTGVDNGPLHALRDGQDGANGVYKYGASGFPNQTYNSANYWVDVVFVTSAGADTTPPQVAAVGPAPAATGVAVTTAVTATFNENVTAATVTSTNVQLRNAANALVAASLSYDAGSRTATLQPGSSLVSSATYTATVRGGSTGIKDVAGNALAADAVWSFTTGAPAPPPPTDGPGGPILVIASSANPFTRYYAEILRNEGMNSFLVSDIGSVTASSLTAYDVVILGEMPLTAAQVTMFSSWVNAGGNLIAMRPDKQLATLLGLTDAAATLSEGYLSINTSTAPGAGIVGQTMQIHGVTDRYTIAGATTIATLYSNGTTATISPAVTMRTVGSAGGQAAAFAYDLAKSVVYTRQGNPAWAGQDRDGQAPVRSDDLFFGGTVPDWVDRAKIAIPQADEQQRLLANMINFMNVDRKPLPRFWYLPRGLKAAVVMTGDDHGYNGTAGRFDIYNNQSPAGCSVADWQCIRATSYIYPTTPLNQSQAVAFVADGFEIGVHTSTGCGDYTAASIDSNFSSEIASFLSHFPGLPSPRSNRTHCIVWSDYTSQAEAALTHGIRFDTNYYYWPAVWVNDVPGVFTGSAMPMRFAKADGTLIDVYQAATQLTDESGQNLAVHVDTLLDRALGADGYYGVFTANMHTDDAVHAGSEAIVASAQARGVPIVSAKQMMDWLDGRNASTFSNMTWSGTTLSFTLVVGTGANGLQGMVPTVSSAGAMTGMTRDGTSVGYSTQTIKGVSYAMFVAAAGTYQVQYAVDTTAPSIIDLTAVAGTTSATVSWTTIEPATTLVSYGVNAGSLTSTASTPGSSTSHSVVLNGLTPGTQYFYRATSADAAGNSTSSPSSAATFTTTITPPVVTTVSDTTVADFGGGSGAAVYVAATADGEVTLAPAAGAEFFGTALPAGWSSTPWNTGGTSTVAAGTMKVDGARANTATLFSAGVALEFVATFATDRYQHAGLADTLDAAPWAMFSTGSGDALYARTNSGSASTDTLLPGNWLNAAHLYRIEWSASTVTYLIDGVVVATHPIAIAQNMRPIASDYNTGGGALLVDRMRLSPYASSGTFTSRILDGGAATNWGTVNWTSVIPANTAMVVSVRFGDTAVPDASWTTFSTVSASGASLSNTSRYIQYQAVLSSTVATVTPSLTDITFTSSSGPTSPVISIADLSIDEGNSGTTSAVVTLTLSAPSASAVTVVYTSADGTATAGSDYTAVSGTATFAPGATTTTIAAPVAGDTVVEPNETFVVNLTSAADATIGDSQGVVTIVNDDVVLPSITIADQSLNEGNSGTTSAIVTLTLSAASASAVTVNYATANGTAAAGSDYTAKSGTATFAAGTTATTISVLVSGDTGFEANETFAINLSAPVNATITDAQALVTIVNDDVAPSITIADRSITEGNTGTTSAVVTLTLSAASTSAVSVNYATANGTATAGSDYTAKSGTATFAAGARSTTISIVVTGDTVVELTETFAVNLTLPVNAIVADDQAIVTIVNDDLPRLTIGSRSVSEGETGTVAAAFTVTLAPASASIVTVTYATVNGTALSTSDYTATSGTLTFAPGTTTQTITVPVRGDMIDEVDESFGVNLSAPSNAALGTPSQGIGTIVDDDAAPTLSIADVSAAETGLTSTTVTFAVQLSAVSSKAVRVNYATANGTALSGSDYTAKGAALTIAAGQTTATFTVTILNDLVREGVETFVVNLSGATNATIADSQAICTITDND